MRGIKGAEPGLIPMGRGALDARFPSPQRAALALDFIHARIGLAQGLVHAGVRRIDRHHSHAGPGVVQHPGLDRQLQHAVLEQPMPEALYRRLERLLPRDRAHAHDDELIAPL